jgi:deoxyribodipyrimidine photo-lyase
MVSAAAKRIRARFEAVDANGVVPMRTPGRCFVTAYSFRAYLQANLRPHLAEWPAPLDFAGLPRLDALPEVVTTRWKFTAEHDLDAPDRMIAALPIDHSVPMVPTRGGHAAAEAALTRFVDRALAGYTDDRNQPSIAGTSRLSPYLHFGHIGAHEVFNALMTREQWTSRKLAAKGGGAKAGWWGTSPAAEAYLDQLITWRELGFNMCVERPDDYDAYASLPNWARATLDAHARDRRQWQYSIDQFSAADTHDAVWNAAQRELTQTGWMHNYLRMLWGKKILEWTRSPDDALHAMVEVMNRFALDGRDPNSYTGYMWTLGRYDRPWAPEREIFGTIRYMSSDNTVRKLKMKPYLAQYGAG